MTRPRPLFLAALLAPVLFFLACSAAQTKSAEAAAQTALSDAQIACAGAQVASLADPSSVPLADVLTACKIEAGLAPALTVALALHGLAAPAASASAPAGDAGAK